MPQPRFFLLSPVRYGPATTTGHIFPLMELMSFTASGCRKNRPSASHCRNGSAAPTTDELDERDIGAQARERGGDEKMEEVSFAPNGEWCVRRALRQLWRGTRRGLLSAATSGRAQGGGTYSSAAHAHPPPPHYHISHTQSDSSVVAPVVRASVAASAPRHRSSEARRCDAASSADPAPTAI